MWILLSLAAGLAAGFLLRSWDLVGPVVQVAEPIGQVWVNALRMCVIPLVVSCIVVSVGSSLDTTALGRIGWRAAALFLRRKSNGSWR